MTGDSRIASVGDATALIARLESVPFSRWHLRPRIIVGSATFFDAFDALSLAFVLPVLVRLWGLSPGHIGSLISVGYLGQFLGALIFGSLADAIGRVRAAVSGIFEGGATQPEPVSPNAAAALGWRRDASPAGCKRTSETRH